MENPLAPRGMRNGAPGVCRWLSPFISPRSSERTQKNGARTQCCCHPRGLPAAMMASSTGRTFSFFFTSFSSPFFSVGSREKAHQASLRRRSEGPGGGGGDALRKEPRRDPYRGTWLIFFLLLVDLSLRWLDVPCTCGHRVTSDRKGQHWSSSISARGKPGQTRSFRKTIGFVRLELHVVRDIYNHKPDPSQ